MRTKLFYCLMLIPFYVKSQTYTFSIFNKQEALQYGIPYFKGKEPITGGEVMIDYQLADDFYGSMDLKISFKNLDSCSENCFNKTAYVVEMTATVLNNTNRTMIAGEVRAGFPRLPIGNEETKLYLPANCEPSSATCSAGSGVFHHIASDGYVIPFNSSQTLTDCGIYPPDEFLILKPGESRTIKKKEWLTVPTISLRPFFERGRVTFCLTKDDHAKPRNDNTENNYVDMIFSYHDPNWPTGDSYAFMNFNCPTENKYYITEVFKYDHTYLTDDLLRSYYRYLKSKIGLTDSYVSLTGSGNGNCQIYMEKGIRPLTKDEAEQIRTGVIAPLEREKISVNNVKIKLN